MGSAIIVDLDGTLTSCEHRRHFVTNGNKNWRDFNYNIPFDAPVPGVRDIVWGAWDNGTPVVFCSGRSQDYYAETVEWLFDHVFAPYMTDRPEDAMIDYQLLMRGFDDYRNDAVVKKDIYDWRIKPFYDIEFVVDDRWPVIQMWESLGLFVLRVTDPGLEPIYER